VIAGLFIAHGEHGHQSAVQIASRISGPENGQKITDLCTATIRAVAQGVVGIAFIQMLLIGIGFVTMGIPGAGLLALAVLLIGIMQLPATLITIPVIVFVIVTQGVGLATIAFAIYGLVVGLADNVLKRLLLGRGVAVPIPVVLIGALGGMVSGGVIGLFIGPVMHAVGYQLFWRWVRDQPAAVLPAENVTTSASSTVCAAHRSEVKPTRTRPACSFSGASLGEPQILECQRDRLVVAARPDRQSVRYGQLCGPVARDGHRERDPVAGVVLPVIIADTVDGRRTAGIEPHVGGHPQPRTKQIAAVQLQHAKRRLAASPVAQKGVVVGKYPYAG
jgi:AI-2E family transporter